MFRRTIAVAACCALSTAAFSPAASAAPQNKASSAFGLSASGLVAIQPLVPLDSTNGFQQRSQVKVNPAAGVHIGVVNTEVDVNRAKASVTDLKLQLAGLDVAALSASVIRATCVDGVGQATLASAKIGAVPLDLAPAPNTTVPVPGVASIVLNKQTRNADGSLTVTAIWIEINGVQRIQISSATCAKGSANGGGSGGGGTTTIPPTPGDNGNGNSNGKPQAPRPTPVKGHHPVTG